MRTKAFRSTWLLIGLIITAQTPGVTAQAGGRPSQGVHSLPGRTHTFLEAVRSRDPARIAAFFPARGEFTYVHTRHLQGRDSVASVGMPAAAALGSIRSARPRPSFSISMHGQQIGLFLYQVICRGTSWRRGSGTRFVPPKADTSSAIFVEWRLEDSTWVISALGDESFTNQPTPTWAC
jgi:hypothetical protein